MIKLLIGGSPCTSWSIAQKNSRETEPSGIGWELFKNYLIARDKFKPDFFLYENNKSAASAIKNQICFEFDTPLMYINSALVSAQQRQRFYVFNWEVEQPQDRGILLRDIIESGECWREKSYTIDAQYYKTGGVYNPNKQHSYSRHMVAEQVGIPYEDKACCLTASYGKGPTIENTIERKQRSMIAIPVCVAGRMVGRKINEKGRRDDYNESLDTIQRFEANENQQKTNALTTVQKDNMIAVPVEQNLKEKTIYEVKDGMITVNGKQYAIKLHDGLYIIRKLSVTECERLQTMPDGYCRAVSATQAYKGLGNGWTAEVIIHILNGALKGVPRDEPIQVLSMYDGIGTGRYCLDKMGFGNVEYHAYEIDKYAMQVSGSNYRDIIQHGDAFAVREGGWGI